MKPSEARRSELDTLFSKAAPEVRQLINPLFDELVTLECRLEKLRAQPFIIRHPNDATRQKITPAAKVYRECSESYMQILRLLTGILKDQTQDGGIMTDGQLLEMLEEIKTGDTVNRQ